MAAYDGVGAHIDALAQFGAVSDAAAPRASFRRLGTLVEGVEQFYHGQTGLVDMDEGGADRVLWMEVVADYDYRGLAFVEVMGVFGIVEKSDAPFISLFDDAGLPGACVLVAFDGALDHAGYLFCGVLHAGLR